MSSTVQKKTQDNMNQKLALVIKSGKYRLGKALQALLQPPTLTFLCLGYKSAIKALRQG